MAYGIVAHTVASSGDTNSVTTPAIDTTGANLIYLAVSDFLVQPLGTISDNKGNTWTIITVGGDGDGNFCRISTYFCLNPTVGAGHTFTYSGTAVYPSMTALALSGAAAASVLDQKNTNSSLATTTLATGSVTPSENNEIVITSTSDLSVSGSKSIDSGFTISDQMLYSPGSFFGIGTAYLIQTSAGAVNPTWTYGTSTETVAEIATFKAAAASGNLFRPSQLAGLGAGGPFFQNPLN